MSSSNSTQIDINIQDVIVCVLEDIINLNNLRSATNSYNSSNTSYNNNQTNSIFDLKTKPAVNISQYISRINQYVQLSEEEFLINLVLIDRLAQTNIILNNFNIHKICLALMRVITKFFSDYYVNNEIFAKIGGISQQDMNEIEMEVLKLLNFQLYVDYQVLEEYKKQIMQYYFEKQKIIMESNKKENFAITMNNQQRSCENLV